MMTPPADLRARVLAAAARSPSPSRRSVRHVAAGAIALAVAVAATVFELAGGFSHSAGRPQSLTFMLAGGWTAVTVALTWLIVGRGGATLARSPLVVGAASLATPFVAFAWMSVFSGLYAEPFERVGYRCFAYTLLVGATPLAAFMRLRRGVEPRAPSVLGAAAGMMAGAWGGVVVDLWCPLTNAPHSLVGHVLPLVVLSVVGALVGRLALGVRSFSAR